ncbi:MAG: excinuclease ABC subunit UvrC [Actinomycetaceae bacterium]|nr:excinuclease ABC subunit UvrC [Actinomycetaceae bacterium]MDY6083201.1 excinuclease ABC subunit UvrC [Actinomycetaceae bacterium]
MTNPADYRPEKGALPTDPGVYRFLDSEGKVLYVGKAKNLRNRVSHYFRDETKIIRRIRQMLHMASKVEWVVVGSEIEALTLEFAWINEFEPPFNVVFRDDKSYPYLAVSVGEDVPRVWITRGKHRKGVRYFGPYTKVWAIKETLEQLRTAFPVRTCTAGVYADAQRSQRPCLLGYIGKCSAPCVGRITHEEHRAMIDSLLEFMDGDASRIIAKKKKEMLAASQEERYEDAAKLRDEISALTTINERNVVAFESDVNADIFGLEADEIEASVQVFYVRGGRIRGQRGWISEEVAGMNSAQILTQLLMQVYGDSSYDDARELLGHREESTSIDDRRHVPVTAIPSEIWLPTLPENVDEIEQWISQRRGGAVHIKSPERGAKAQLTDTVHKNAVQALERHKLARVNDLTVRSQALEELQEQLELPRAPLRIECYDISHMQGKQQVASMVVFEDGAPKKSDYRHFIIRGPNGEGGIDDTAAMDEVLHRRLSRLTQGAHASDAGAEEDDAYRGLVERSTSADRLAEEYDAPDPVTDEGNHVVDSQARRFAYKPDLLVVDGGLPQVNAAQRVVDELHADVRIVGLAKRLEEVWIPGEEFPVIFPRNSAALRLLQYVRDESHRFAITFHRKRRSQAMTRSALDNVPGLGPAKQKALLKSFGSLAKIREASPRELQTVPGIGPALAAVIDKTLHHRDDADAQEAPNSLT